MDSEEEEDDKKEEKEKKEEDEDKVNAEELNNVQSFGRMVILAPALLKWFRSGSMTPADVGTACSALERTKFFDGDILEELYVLLKKLFEQDRLSLEQAHNALLCLHTLNAFDESVFCAAAAAFFGRTASMESGLRNVWAEMFQRVSDEKVKKFVQLLQVPPLDPTNPGYRKLRCTVLNHGHCLFGSSCSFSHETSAPLSFENDNDNRQIRKTVAATGKEAGIDQIYKNHSAHRERMEQRRGGRR